MQPNPDELVDERAEPVRRCLDVLSSTPSGLVTDIDGTISVMAPTPGEAVVTEEARRALRGLAERLAFVGVVTGRSATVGESLVGVPGLVYVGNHGTERRHNGTTWMHPEAAATASKLGHTLRAIYERASALGAGHGLVVEDKGLSGSIHYRLAPRPDQARLVLVELANEAAAEAGLLVTEGRLVVELRPRLRVNKGTALVDLIREHNLRGVVFLGDDLTDVDAFRAVRELRDAGEIDGLRVGVLAPETQPLVLAETDVTVRGVEACVELLQEIAERLPSPR